MGSHAILCFNGALGTATGMGGLTQQIEFFSDKKQFTVVGFDVRGYGESIPPTRDFQISPVHFLKQDVLDGHQLMQNQSWGFHSSQYSDGVMVEYQEYSWLHSSPSQ